MSGTAVREQAPALLLCQQSEPRERVVLHGCLSLLRCFPRSSVPVLVVDSDPESLTPKSRWCHRFRPIACPRNEPSQAVADLIAIGKQFSNPPMLAYDSDAMLLLVSRNREVLSKYYRLLLPEPDLIEDTVDKLRFVGLSERLNLPAPRSIIPTPQTTAEEIVATVGLPCILKPDSHVGRFLDEVSRAEQGRPYKALRVDTLPELQMRLRQMHACTDAFIVQEYIGGTDNCLYSFHTYFDRNSRPLSYYVGRKIRTYPKDSGFSTCLELTLEPEVVRLGLELLAKMKLVGPMKLDFKKDAVHNRFVLLECNARFTLWSGLGKACGINLPQMAYDYLHGRDVPLATQYRTNVKWLSLGNDFRGFVRDYHPAGDWTWPGYLWSLGSRTVHEAFAWRDPLPALASAARYLRGKWQHLGHRIARRKSSMVQPAVSKQL